jgi:hypothetical protein
MPPLQYQKPASFVLLITGLVLVAKQMRRRV